MRHATPTLALLYHDVTLPKPDTFGRDRSQDLAMGFAAKVIDGDSVEVLVGGNHQLRMRLSMIAHLKADSQLVTM